MSTTLKRIRRIQPFWRDMRWGRFNYSKGLTILETQRVILRKHEQGSTVLRRHEQENHSEEAWKGVNHFEETRGVNLFELTWGVVNHSEETWKGFNCSKETWEGVYDFKVLTLLETRGDILRISSTSGGVNHSDEKVCQMRSEPYWWDSNRVSRSKKKGWMLSHSETE